MLVSWGLFFLRRDQGADEGEETAAGITYAIGNTRRVLHGEAFTPTTITTNTQVFDVFGAPQLGTNLQAQVLALECHESHAHGSGKDFFDACVELRLVAEHLITDGDIFHAGMLPNLHRALCIMRASSGL